MIIKASIEQFKEVKKITQDTIAGIYPKYYPTGAVDFFKKHHNDESIRMDLQAGLVYLLVENDEYVGTVTVKGNEICRLFVLPKFQHKGYGQELLDFAEEKVGATYDVVMIDASLPAKKIYKLRGYSEIEYHQIISDNRDVLCYDFMKKELAKNSSAINYEGKVFVPSSNTENGEVDGKTVFTIIR